MQKLSDDIKTAIAKNVADALVEDIGGGDLTAALVEDEVAGATIIARQSLVLAGQPWVDEIFHQLDENIVIDWYIGDGQSAECDDVICKLVGNARALLSGERTALNFLQFLSATATSTANYVRSVEGTKARILDTRKTLPGLRQAQKYAVRVGGGENHRMGLYDAVLIKENHIRSAGSVAEALSQAQQNRPNAIDRKAGTEAGHQQEVLIEVEVESIDELYAALDAGARRILLDNFSVEQLAEAVNVNGAYGYVGAELEASGNITLENIREVAETGVDYISVGALTKNVAAVDLSMLLRID